MSRIRGKIIESDYPGIERRKKFLCPIDIKKHKHFHHSTSNMFYHIEMYNFCVVQVIFQRVRSKDGTEWRTGAAAVNIGGMGTFYVGDPPAYLDHSARIAEIVAGMLRKAYRVKEVK